MISCNCEIQKGMRIGGLVGRSMGEEPNRGDSGSFHVCAIFSKIIQDNVVRKSYWHYVAYQNVKNNNKEFLFATPGATIEIEVLSSYIPSFS